MPDASLRDRRILVVEDDPRISRDLTFAFEDAGAIVVGPCATIRDAIATTGANERIDGAVLDVNLGGEMVFPVAYDLARLGVPFVFLTGFDSSVVAVRFSDVPAFEKPVDPKELVLALATASSEPKRRSA